MIPALSLRGATIAVFATAALLRLFLATVNRESSDNHVDLIEYMAFENTIPEYDRDRDRVKEAFQPKLYHAVVAGLLKVDPFDMESARPCASEYPGSSPHVIWVGQMVSAIAGVLTIYVILRFLHSIDVSERARFFTFALVALNPALVTINVQVTNDSFMILFGSLSLFWGYRFFRDFRLRDFVCMTAAATATAMSKGTGLPMCLAMMAVFVIALGRNAANGTPGRGTMLRYAVVFPVVLVATFTIVAPKLGTYLTQYRLYGSPFVTNRIPQPFPRLFERTDFPGDPGVRSIAESIFTFRIVDLLEHPFTPTRDEPGDTYPLHRTSLWSQIYGRLNSIRFETMPSWRPRSAVETAVARIAYVVALFPAALLVFGAYTAAVRALSDPRGVRPHEWLIGIAAAGYTAFLVALALRYRDFSFFKPIHAFAGLLAFSVLLARAYDWFVARFDGGSAVRVGDVLLGLLIGLYALDCTLLAAQLFESCRGA